MDSEILSVLQNSLHCSGGFAGVGIGESVGITGPEVDAVVIDDMEVEAAARPSGGKVFPGALICALPSMTWQFLRQTSWEKLAVSQKTWQGFRAPPVGYESGGDDGMMGVSADDDDTAADSRVVGAAVGMMSILEDDVAEPADTPVGAVEIVALAKDWMSEGRIGTRG